jgi:flagellar biosynthesis/type III secretory pathway chaperone
MEGDERMTGDERARLVRTILDRHDEALHAFHDANEAFDRAIASMRETLTAVHDANHAQGDAINGVIAANRAALTLLNDETHG